MSAKPPRKPGLFEHYEELIGAWTRRLRNRQEAEDLAHDTYVRLLETPQGALAQPRAYLHRTARNLAIDAFRRERAHPPVGIEHLAEHEAPDGDPETTMHAVQLASSIERALAELPPNCRKVFVWQKLEGLSQAEIAERLGLSRNMVEKYMIRTLRHLRDRLDDTP